MCHLLVWWIVEGPGGDVVGRDGVVVCGRQFRVPVERFDLDLTLSGAVCRADPHDRVLGDVLLCIGVAAMESSCGSIDRGHGAWWHRDLPWHDHLWHDDDHCQRRFRFSGNDAIGRSVHYARMS